MLSSAESQIPAMAASKENVKDPELELMGILPGGFYGSCGELTPRIWNKSLGRFVFLSEDLKEMSDGMIRSLLMVSEVDMQFQCHSPKSLLELHMFSCHSLSPGG